MAEEERINYRREEIKNKISSYEVVKETSKKVGRGLLYSLECIYTCPTFARQMDELDGIEWNYGSIFTSSVAGVCISGISGILIGGILDKKIYAGIWLAAAVTTNLSSSLYEVYRYTKKQMQKQKNLESKASFEQISQKGEGGFDNTFIVK